MSIKFYDIQKKVFEYTSKNNTLLVVHNTGAGKTLSALESARLFLDENHEHNIIVVSPTAVLKNFHKEVKKYNDSKVTLKRYQFYSFRALPNATTNNDVLDNVHNSMLIIDEVHNLRNIKTKASIAAIQLSKLCKKVLLLTATPFVNYLGDFRIYIRLLYKGIEKYDKCLSAKPKKGTARYGKDLMSIQKYLNKKVSYENVSASGDYPTYTEHDTNVHMTPEYYEKYIMALKKVGVFGKNPEAFYHGYRRAVNSAGLDEYYSAKILKFVELYRGYQTLIFSNWLEFGVEVIAKILKEKNIIYEIIDGSVTAKQRMDIVDEFNASIFKVLIITRAGYEGLDLKNVSQIFILDPVWNHAGYLQIIGRGIRCRSHADLPKEKRHVDIYRMILTSPDEYSKSNKEIEMEILGQRFIKKTGDEILYLIIKQKKEILSDVIEVLKLASI